MGPVAVCPEMRVATDVHLHPAVTEPRELMDQTGEDAHGFDELSVPAQLVERRLRHGDAELRLEGERELDEIQRIDRELVRERDIARQLFGPDAEMICYQAPHARLHEIKHTQ